jgi:hypothetical protein
MSTSKKQKGGDASGVKRAALAKLRQLEVLSAYERLAQPYQNQPFSNRTLEELQNELDKSERRRSVLKALEQTLEQPLPPYESAVEVIEDPVSHLLGQNVRKVAPRLHPEKYDALLDEVVSGLLSAPKNKKKTKASDDGRQERITRDLKDLEIKSKRSEKRSR